MSPREWPDRTKVMGIYPGESMTKYLLCKDCKWFEAVPIGTDFLEARCSNPQTQVADLVLGNHSKPLCESVRAKGQPCGPDGNLWEAKE